MVSDAALTTPETVPAPPAERKEQAADNASSTQESCDQTPDREEREAAVVEVMEVVEAAPEQVEAAEDEKDGENEETEGKEKGEHPAEDSTEMRPMTLNERRRVKQAAPTVKIPSSIGLGLGLGAGATSPARSLPTPTTRHFLTPSAAGVHSTRNAGQTRLGQTLKHTMLSPQGTTINVFPDELSPLSTRSLVQPNDNSESTPTEELPPPPAPTYIPYQPAVTGSPYEANPFITLGTGLQLNSQVLQQHQQQQQQQQQQTDLLNQIINQQNCITPGLELDPINMMTRKHIMQQQQLLMRQQMESGKQPHQQPPANMVAQLPGQSPPLLPMVGATQDLLQLQNQQKRKVKDAKKGLYATNVVSPGDEESISTVPMSSSERKLVMSIEQFLLDKALNKYEGSMPVVVTQRVVQENAKEEYDAVVNKKYGRSFHKFLSEHAKLRVFHYSQATIEQNSLAHCTPHEGRVCFSDIPQAELTRRDTLTAQWKSEKWSAVLDKVESILRQEPTQMKPLMAKFKEPELAQQFGCVLPSNHSLRQLLKRQPERFVVMPDSVVKLPCQLTAEERDEWQQKVRDIDAKKKQQAAGSGKSPQQAPQQMLMQQQQPLQQQQQLQLQQQQSVLPHAGCSSMISSASNSPQMHHHSPTIAGMGAGLEPAAGPWQQSPTFNGNVATIGQHVVPEPPADYRQRYTQPSRPMQMQVPMQMQSPVAAAPLRRTGYDSATASTTSTPASMPASFSSTPLTTLCGLDMAHAPFNSPFGASLGNPHVPAAPYAATTPAFPFDKMTLGAQVQAPVNQLSHLQQFSHA